jgi:deoxyribodipyrimidine photolyase-related protein
MRSYGDKLKSNKYKIEYSKIEDKDFKKTYFEKLKNTIIKKKKNRNIQL